MRNQIDNEIQVALSRYVTSKNESPYLVLANVVAPIVYRHREHMRVLYNTALDPTWTQFLDEKHRIWLEPYIKNCPENLQVSHDFLLKFLPRQVTTLFAVWLSEDFPEPPEVFTKTFLRLITHPPVDFLSLDK